MRKVFPGVFLLGDKGKAPQDLSECCEVLEKKMQEIKSRLQADRDDLNERVPNIPEAI
ncbi:hypothetical protein RY280_23540 [Bacillus paralicheniformis]|uniref:hypothetical protein n=1 Tax=Bacillus paralicheniformis TaxID=1648923 RepID=UPI003A8C64CB